MESLKMLKDKVVLITGTTRLEGLEFFLASCRPAPHPRQLGWPTLRRASGRVRRGAVRALTVFLPPSCRAGASSGIGAGAAVVFAKHGCRLVLTGRNLENLKKTQKECVDSGLKANQVVTVTGAVENTDDCKKIVQTAIDSFGQLDVLVNNAGFAVRGTSQTLSPDDFDRQLNINVRSVFQLAKFAIPHLQKTKGNIVNISSVAGIRAVVGSLAYCTSKAAVDHLTRNLALECAASGVRVNCLSPGLIVTEFQKRAGMPEEAYPEFVKTVGGSQPLGRAGLPEDVAKVIVFLASDMAGFVTGQTIFVDGGSHVGSAAFKLPGAPGSEKK